MKLVIKCAVCGRRIWFVKEKALTRCPHCRNWTVVKPVKGGK